MRHPNDMMQHNDTIPRSAGTAATKRHIVQMTNNENTE